MFRVLRSSAASIAAVMIASIGAPRSSQAQAPATVARLVAEPARVTMKAGESVSLKVTALDQAGKPVPDALVRVGGVWNALSYDSETQQLKALRAGEFELSAS